MSHCVWFCEHFFYFIGIIRSSASYFLHINSIFHITLYLLFFVVRCLTKVGYGTGTGLPEVHGFI